MKNRLVFTVILGLFFGSPSASALVSFFFIEAGLSHEVINNNQSLVWENAFLDVFFEAGHIVTNFPVLRLENKPQDEILYEIDFDLADGRSMGINFIIITVLDFSYNLQTPAEISFFIYNINTGEKSYERQIPGKTYRSSVEEINDIKAIARGLIPFVR